VIISRRRFTPIPQAFIGAAGVDSLPAFWRRGARADEAAAARVQEIGQQGGH